MKYGKREYMGSSLMVTVARALPHHMRSKVLIITKLETPPQYRRQGYANTLLALVTAEADIAGKVLMLKVGDGMIGGASKQQLLNFYQRHGFMPIQAEPLLMARTPISARLPNVAALTGLAA